ncbi:reverse transcriptase family protein [Agrobacterium tumefaciens]|uniref:reverse transcriptase family protein n=1 Tax=Agrobacterium tumefaciens TaxID=358 RepID=UPI00046F7914
MAFVYDFTRITTRDALLDALAIDGALFDQILAFEPPPPAWLESKSVRDSIGTISIPAFFRHDIPKRNASRGHRTVWEPALAMGSYKALARRLDDFFRYKLVGYPHDSSFGYRPGRNIRENAAPHRGKKFLLSMDLESFFPSISGTRVAGLFETLGVQPNVANLLARFVTLGNGLAMGFPTSPVISNAVALPLDQALQQLARSTGWTYTRYSDDISVSSDNSFPEIDQISGVIFDNGFQLAEGKTRWSRQGQAHFVTGLSISDPAQPHVPKAKKQKLRQELYYAQKFGLADHIQRKGVNDPKIMQQEVNRLDGLVKFVSYHEQKLSPRLKEQWHKIITVADMKPSFEPRKMSRVPFALIIDEAEFPRGDRRYLALCIVATQHVDKVIGSTRQVLTTALNDLWADGNRQSLLARGLHFTDATKDLQLAYIKELMTIPIEGYVAFCELHSHQNYETVYLRLMAAMMPRRLMAAESQKASIMVEQNSKVSQTLVNRCIADVFAELKRTNNRRPRDLTINFVTKPNPILSPPDFLLGVLGQYLRSKPAEPEPRERLNFERLRDKFRLILDLDNDIEFSRRRPISPW